LKQLTIQSPRRFKFPSIFPLLSQGLDPLNIGDVSVNRGFDMRLIALNVYGISNFIVEKIRVNSARKDKFKVSSSMLLAPSLE
jgi:hypothetical protein